MIRYHSFYPWHREGAYMHLCNEEDMKQLHAVKAFNREFGPAPSSHRTPLHHPSDVRPPPLSQRTTSTPSRTTRQR
jgi:hypothetical protein